MTAHIKKTARLFIKLLLLFSLTSCAAGALVSEAGLGGMAARGLLGEVVATEVIAGSEVATLARMSVAANSLGELEVINSAATNDLFRRLTVRYVKGQSPRLYAEGISEPIADIYTNSRKIKFLGQNALVDIPKNVFSIVEDGVNVRRGSGIGFESTGIKVYKRDLVIKLAEKDGWYKIRIARNPKPVEGWVKGIYLIPLMSLGENEQNGNQHTTDNSVRQTAVKPKEYDCAEMRTGDFSFTNKTNKTLTVLLYPESMPTAYIGNPGNDPKRLTLAAYEQKFFYRLPADIYKYSVLETVYGGESLVGRINY